MACASGSANIQAMGRAAGWRGAVTGPGKKQVLDAEGAERDAESAETGFGRCKA